LNPATRATLAGMAALALGMGIGRFAYTPLLPALIADAGLTIEAAGDIAAANFAGYLAGALAAARVPRARRTQAFLAAIALSIAGTLLMAWLRHPAALGLTRGLSGVASAFVLVQGSSIVLDELARQRRPDLFPWLYAGVGAGIALTAVIVEAMSRAGAGGSATWTALGFASLLLAGPACAMRDPPPPVPEPSRPSSSRARPPSRPSLASADAVSGPAPATSEARARALRLLTIAYGGLGFGYVITATFIVVIVRARADWQAWEMAVWFVVGASAAPSNLMWLALTRRVGPWNAMIGAFLVQAIGVLAAVTASSLAWVMLGAAFLGGTIVAITAMGLSTAREIATGDSNRVLGTMTAAFGVGQIAGPAVGGRLAEASGSFLAPSALAASVLAGSALLLAIAARALRPSAPGGRSQP
jgi:predicted MFS family arabinose efflux permease